RAARLMIETVRHRVFWNAGIDQEYLAILRLGIGFRDGGPSTAKRLHLRTHKCQAGLESRLDRIGVTGLSIVGDDAPLGFFLLAGHGSARHASVPHGEPATSIALRTRARAASLAATIGLRSASLQTLVRETAFFTGAGLAS